MVGSLAPNQRSGEGWVPFISLHLPCFPQSLDAMLCGINADRLCVYRRQRLLAVVTVATEKKPLSGGVAQMAPELFAMRAAYTTPNLLVRWVRIKRLSWFRICGPRKRSTPRHRGASNTGLLRCSSPQFFFFLFFSFFLSESFPCGVQNGLV